MYEGPPDRGIFRTRDPPCTLLAFALHCVILRVTKDHQTPNTRMNLRQQLQQALSLLFIGASAYMFWKGLSVATNSSSPIVVVLSGSMEPAFKRGDVLFLWNRNERSSVGDVVVYEINKKSIPIVHRVVREHHNDNKQLLLTKGDNNPVDDLGLYAHGQNYLDKEKDIVGTVKGFFPYVGYITILITENQYFKYGLLGLIALSSVLSGEES